MINLTGIIPKLKLFLYILFFGLGVYAGISLIRYKPQLFQLKQIPQDQIEINAIMEKVGKLMSLPEGEIPTLQTINDLSLLKDNAFFIKAEAGDKVLIFSKAALAILYRPSKNLIINTASPNYEVAYINLATPSPEPLPTAVPTPVPTPVPVVTPEPVSTVSGVVSTPVPVIPTATPKI